MSAKVGIMSLMINIFFFPVIVIAFIAPIEVGKVKIAYKYYKKSKNFDPRLPSVCSEHPRGHTLLHRCSADCPLQLLGHLDQIEELTPRT